MDTLGLARMFSDEREVAVTWAGNTYSTMATWEAGEYVMDASTLGLAQPSKYLIVTDEHSGEEFEVEYIADLSDEDAWAYVEIGLDKKNRSVLVCPYL